ncbi:hypothetical protein AMAG_15397 [Allomyces macrogynus ATCC 38327]|uniref:Uncharacterized protein n=1 Tax=Allomyces macrogynus (strain ATCC 38327) TaxID=578462 RepID=A0A0L0T7G8_ALLM3|nr:hypothetical protein AMAG_15397 [Allomyces macrogynus ATCC 38327]|eukprot:KNE70641.1 hypothetical protein AMAG_15397 [Allomyces macrogynus ATCC 38327]
MIFAPAYAVACVHAGTVPLSVVADSPVPSGPHLRTPHNPFGALAVTTLPPHPNVIVPTSSPGPEGSESAIAVPTTLTPAATLHLANWHADLAPFASALANAPDITDLRLVNAGLSTADLRLLASTLPNTAVRALHVDGNSAPDLPWSSLLSPTLIHVSLRGNKLTDDAGIRLAASLRTHHALASLNLARNYLARATCDVLANLAHNTTLHLLSLAGNKITDEALVALARGALAKVALAHDDAAVRKRYFAELESTAKPADEEAYMHKLVVANAVAQAAAAATAGEWEEEGRGARGDSSADSDDRAGEAGDGKAWGAKGSAAQTGKTLVAGTAGKKGISATDLKVKKPSTPAGADKLAAPSAAGKRGSTMGKKMDDTPADDGEVVVDETQVVEAIVVPPGVDLDVFEADGTYYVWGNRALAYLNVANNKLSMQAVKYQLDVLADQSTDDKTLITTNVYSDPSVRDRPKHGLLRVALQGNLFPMTDPLVQQLDQRLVAKQQSHSATVAAAAAAATATPATTSQQRSATSKYLIGWK